MLPQKLTAMPFRIDKLPVVGCRRCDQKHISAFNRLTSAGLQWCRRRAVGRVGGWGGVAVRPCARTSIAGCTARRVVGDGKERTGPENETHALGWVGAAARGWPAVRPRPLLPQGALPLAACVQRTQWAHRGVQRPLYRALHVAPRLRCTALHARCTGAARQFPHTCSGRLIHLAALQADFRTAFLFTTWPSSGRELTVDVVVSKSHSR